jgi:hypothetical protein
VTFDAVPRVPPERLLVGLALADVLRERDLLVVELGHVRLPLQTADRGVFVDRPRRGLLLLDGVVVDVGLGLRRVDGTLRGEASFDAGVLDDERVDDAALLPLAPDFVRPRRHPARRAAALAHRGEREVVREVDEPAVSAAARDAPAAGAARRGERGEPRSGRDVARVLPARGRRGHRRDAGAHLGGARRDHRRGRLQAHRGREVGSDFRRRRRR